MSARFVLVFSLALLLTSASATLADPALPWCPDPGFDDEGFSPCPCPACMAPCAFPAEPQGECKGPDGSVSESSFTCCCCGGGGVQAFFRPFTPYLAVNDSAGGSTLVWTEIPSAVTFDVVRGDLGILRGSGGSFVDATAACADDDNPGTSLAVDASPAPGGCIWFLVRGDGAGSYDAASGSQAAPRDVEIAASGHDCS